MRYRLEELFDLQMGKTPARANPDYWNGSNKWVSISDLSGYDKYVTDTKECISDLGVSESGIKAVPQNTVIMSFKLSIGKTAITTEDIYTNEAIMAFIDKGVCEIDTDYLYYLFSGMDWNKGTNKAVLGLTLNKATLSKKEIDIPDLHTQNEVVKKLDSLSNVIQLQKQSLDKLDELVKSRFVEMFGDPRSNPNSYRIAPFETIVEYMGDIGSNGANKVVVEHLDMKDEEDYALMVRFLNFTKNDFTNDVKYISKESYEFFKKSKLYGGELIICKIGSAGLNYVMPNLNRPVSLGLNQIMVRINNTVLMPFLYQYLHTEYGEYLISGCINGAVTKSITKTELKKIPVLLPPLSSQQRFADFVTQVEKQKATVQQSIDKLEILKKSLMQEYFG